MTRTALLTLFILSLSTDLLVAKFVCPESRGLFPDPNPENCRRFYSCNDHYAYQQYCATGSLFDGAKRNCVDKKSEVKCGPQPTTERTTTTEDPLAATPCDPSTCVLPYCFCSSDGTQIPGGLLPEETPQMILITFDGSVNHLNGNAYATIFNDNRTNPNGCPLKSTFFMSHDYTDYQIVEEFYSKGHEMATGSVTRRTQLEESGVEGWIGEMVTMREILNKFAGVHPNDVLGQRAPNLTPGRNEQFEVLVDYGFAWDSSLTVPPTRVPVWPYTLDHLVPHECKSATCPTRPYEGVWELPINSHYENTEYNGGFCPYLDQCVLHFLSEAETFIWLKKDFEKYYNNNRAPYMLSLSANWFNTPVLHRSLLKFIDYTLDLPDVYYLTMTQAVEWMINPRTISDILVNGYPSWECDETLLPAAPCNNANTCRVVLDQDSIGLSKGAGGTRYMKTCSTCPRVYPWVYDAGGQRKNDTYAKFVPS